MEAWVIVQCVSSVVQLLEFSAKCISKTNEIHQSADDALESNVAIEAAASHLNQLATEVDVAVTTISDPTLHELCENVTKTCRELFDALEKLKVTGAKSRWKSLRKAIRSVWSEGKVAHLEHRLDNFRAELNLHITARLRSQLVQSENEVRRRFDRSDEGLAKILDAIIEQRDVFQVLFEGQATLQRQLHTETCNLMEESNERTVQGISAAVEFNSSRLLAEQGLTREFVGLELEISESNAEQRHSSAIGAIHASQEQITEAVECSREENDMAHAGTQAQIADLKQAIKMLEDQIKEHTEVLKSTLAALNNTRGTKKRKALMERSNAVTAALLALETMYRSLQAVLSSLQKATMDFIEQARSSELWNITTYARKFSRPSMGSTSSTTHLIELDRQPSLGNPRHGLSPYFAHELYLKYYYPWVPTEPCTVDVDELNNRWTATQIDAASSQISFEGSIIDDQPCASRPVWLLAIVAAALEAHIADPLTIVAKAFDACISGLINREKRYSFTYGTRRGRLKADFAYWAAFAKSRGLVTREMMSSVPTDAREILEDEQIGEVEALVWWLLCLSEYTWDNRPFPWPAELDLRSIRGRGFFMAVRMTAGGLAVRICETLIELGLKLERTDIGGRVIARIREIPDRTQPSRKHMDFLVGVRKRISLQDNRERTQASNPHRERTPASNPRRQTYIIQADMDYCGEVADVQ